MSAKLALQVAERTERGKGATRRLRRERDLVPAVIYGAGAETRSVSILQKDFRKLLEDETSWSRLLTLKSGDGGEERVILQDLQRHPARGLVLHADFLRVTETTPISVRVPLHFINAETCIGVRQEGGNISRKVSRVRIRCLPAALPEYIEVDLAEVHVKQSVRLSDLTLPEGVEIPQLKKSGSHNLQVAAVNPPRGAGGKFAEDEAEATETQQEQEQEKEE